MVDRETMYSEDILKENYQNVLSFIYHVTKDRYLAEDITQETFIKALKNIHTFRNESSLSVWLNKIGYNLFLDDKRKRVILSSSTDISPKLIADNSLALKVEQKIMSDCVQSKLLLLTETYRAPLFLDINGYSNLEIADILNCTLENAKIRLHRARKKMKEILGKDCNLYHDERNVLCCSHKKITIEL